MALIDIGSHKQLFVDDYLIESMTDTMPVMNPARKVENNPVLQPEMPWEGNDVRPRHIFFDEQDRVFKMLYQAKSCSGRQGDGEVIVVGHNDPPINCLALSEDGVHWERPVLGQVEFQGSKRNNIIPMTALEPEKGILPRTGAPAAIQDLHETDPTRRFKALGWTKDTNAPMQAYLYYSPDGFNWTPYEGNPIFDTSPRIGRWGPAELMGWDPIRQTYAIHIENSHHRRGPAGKRLIGRAESPDMIEWSDPETILVPDEDDPPDTEFYAMPTIAYEGIYVAMPWVFRTTNTTHHPELAFSRDGVHYRRDYRSPFITRGHPLEFDGASIYSRVPIVHGDRILTFYNGTNWRSPEQLLALGDRATAAVGLAVTPLDGFVSLDGTKGLAGTTTPLRPRVAEFSEVVTRSFSFSGSRLHLNVQTALQQWGAGPPELRVELLEPNHAYIAGHEFKDADPITASGLDAVASWCGRSDLSGLEGRAIKLRFYFKNCKLYSFQFR
jgi:hypothetical protein